MSWITPLTFVLALVAGQSADEPPAYSREGERVEQQFRAYRERLNGFFASLRTLIDQQTPATAAGLPRLQQQDAPPAASLRFGYGVLPRIVDSPPPAAPPVSVFSYSWPTTDGYIAGENIKLDYVEESLRGIAQISADSKSKVISDLIVEYRKLIANQRTIDQYIQYNQFWQRAIAQDRPRFDQLTKVYELLKSTDPDTAQAIREVLGKPDVPSFVKFDRSQPDRVVVQVPVYTDIEDDDFIARVKKAIEDVWQSTEGDLKYVVEVDIRKVPPAAELGARIDVRTHAATFPQDAAVLTTGAQTTHSLVGRYIALAPGDVSTRTIAHEFGHILGFRDGYVRGYRDLGEHGFEILELTSTFDDIMSAPRDGHVQPAHFKLILETAKGN
jgi:hypothetical protein